jgi:plasmid stabilization system protein ParE
MNKLSISPEAKKDLEEIKAYITENLENPIAAVAVKHAIKFPFSFSSPWRPSP